METQMKTCRVCSETKPLAEFYAHPSNADRHDQQCKECRKVTSRKRHARVASSAEFKEAAARRARRARLRLYGITQDDYDRLLGEQDTRCAICGAERAGGRFAVFPVDHDHETGKRRGLLCNDCNLGIARLGDDPDRLIAAAMYLLSYRDVLSEVF